jgi:shikimate dehydrogenase
MISGGIRLVALIGDPVERSLSPAMHNAAFEALGLNCVYLALRVPQATLAGALSGARALNMAGMNVTHPHKIDILGLLDELDESASMVGAVNTVKNDGGRLIGYNTDGDGAVRALESEVGKLAGRKVLLLGAGGAARAIAFSLVKKDAELTVANRTTSRAKELAASIKRSLGVDVKQTSISQKELAKAVKQADILINATTVGMYPNINRTLVTAKMMHRGLIVNDIVYEPLQTRLLREAKRAGARAVTGLGMLVHQGALSFEIWAGKRARVRVRTDAVKRELRRRGKT